jgi:hypothetical protein
MKRDHELTPEERRKRQDKLDKVAAIAPKHFVSMQEQRIRETRELGFLIDKIWPEGSMHLLAGPSGIGKSTWLLKAIHDWEKGIPVMGFTSYPQPYVYLMCDRSATDLQRTLDRIGLGGWNIKGYSIEQMEQLLGIEPETLEFSSLPILFPWARVFFIEAINWFQTETSSAATKDYFNILRFYSYARRIFKGKTVIGTTHIAKTFDKTKVIRPRDRVYGSVGHAATAGTVMILDTDPYNENNRRMYISARDAKDSIANFDVGESGQLEFTGFGDRGKKEEENDEKSKTVILDEKLKEQFKIGDTLLYSHMIEWLMGDRRISKSTLIRWFRKKLAEGMLVKIDKGIYKVKMVTIQ